MGRFPWILAAFAAALACGGGVDKDKAPPPAKAAVEPPPPAPAPEDPDAQALASKLPMHLIGALDVPPNSKIEYFARLERRGSNLAGTLSIPKQGAKDVELVQLMLSADKVTFKLAQADATWTGSFKGDAIECGFQQRGVTLTCSMESVSPQEYAEQAGAGRPQDPKPPFPYDIEEVELTSGGVNLAGTLTAPKDGPHAAVVLISGSGAQDRDETIMGHRPFWVLADHLGRNGVAVLRLDDRGVGGSGGDAADVTMEDMAKDVEAAIAFLGRREHVDAKRIGLIGHSEGGAIGPYVASRTPAVRFVVMLAGPGVTGGELLVEQVVALAKAMGAPEPAVEQARVAQTQAMQILRTTPDDAKARAEIKKLIDPSDAGGDAMAAQLDVIVSPWFRTFVSYDPRPTLAKLDVPVLALNGSLDTQVVAAQNIPAIEKALAGNDDATVQTLEGLNHLFQPAKTGAPAEYGQIEQTLDPAVLQRVATWIGER